MKKLLKSKKGVTILEGLIALTLLALVATGTFAVLLSTSRKTSQPDIREEMALAVDKASQLLQVYIYSDENKLDEDSKETVSESLCPGLDLNPPLRINTEHNIECLLPPICDRNNSSFSYVVTSRTATLPRESDLLRRREENGLYESESINTVNSRRNLYQVEFEISCNGFTL